MAAHSYQVNLKDNQSNAGDKGLALEISSIILWSGFQQPENEAINRLLLFVDSTWLPNTDYGIVDRA